MLSPAVTRRIRPTVMPGGRRVSEVTRDQGSMKRRTGKDRHDSFVNGRDLLLLQDVACEKGYYE